MVERNGKISHVFLHRSGAVFMGVQLLTDSGPHVWKFYFNKIEFILIYLLN